jgi:hypothetical protein
VGLGLRSTNSRSPWIGGATNRSGPNAAPAHTATATVNSRARSSGTLIASASHTTRVIAAACGHTVRSYSHTGLGHSRPTCHRVTAAASPTTR